MCYDISLWLKVCEEHIPCVISKGISVEMKKSVRHNGLVPLMAKAGIEESY